MSIWFVWGLRHGSEPSSSTTSDPARPGGGGDQPCETMETMETERDAARVVMARPGSLGGGPLTRPRGPRFFSRPWPRWFRRPTTTTTWPSGGRCSKSAIRRAISRRIRWTNHAPRVDSWSAEWACISSISGMASHSACLEPDKREGDPQPATLRPGRAGSYRHCDSVIETGRGAARASPDPETLSRPPLFFPRPLACRRLLVPPTGPGGGLRRRESTPAASGIGGR